MSAIGLPGPHVDPHFHANGLCQCPCEKCTLRLTKACVCMDCPCEYQQVSHATPQEEPEMSELRCPWCDTLLSSRVSFRAGTTDFCDEECADEWLERYAIPLE